MPKIRVLVADDEALFREGICALLKLCNNFQIVGQASDGKETIEMVRQKTPDIVVMNSTMPVVDSAEFTLSLHHENVKVLLLSQNEQRELVLRDLRTGANGYIPKRATAAELTAALLAVYKGDYFLHPSIAKTMLEDYSQLTKHQPHSDAYDHMTQKEKEILRLMAAGLEFKKIAERFKVNTRAIFAHQARIMRKLGIQTETELIDYAVSRQTSESKVKSKA